MIPVVCDAFRVSRGGGNFLLSGTIGSDIFVPSISFSARDISPGIHFSLSQLREQNFPLTTFVVSGGQVPKSTLRLASNPTPEGKILLPNGNFFCLFVCCSCLFQILKLEIEKVAAQRSFLFLWCGSHEGLNEGRKVCKVLKLIL